MCQTVTVPEIVERAEKYRLSAPTSCVQNISLWRGNRSATAPPTSERSMIGRNWSEATKASASGELVS